MSMTRSLLMRPKTKLITQNGSFNAVVIGAPPGGGYGPWRLMLKNGSVTFPKAFKEPPTVTITVTDNMGRLLNITPRSTVTTTTISWPGAQIGQVGGPVQDTFPGTWTATGYI